MRKGTAKDLLVIEFACSCFDSPDTNKKRAAGAHGGVICVVLDTR